MHDLDANKHLATQFIDAFNRRDISILEEIFHPDFIWITAVVGDDDPNELRPLHSKLLEGTNLPHSKPRLNREESLTVFSTLFRGQYGDAMKTPSGRKPSEAPLASDAEQHCMHNIILSLTAEEDRVCMEAESDVVRPGGERYNNFYHHMFRIRDDKLILFKEYQDTLHVYDFALLTVERTA